MKALRKVLNELNMPDVIDGETFESEFSFKIREDGNLILIYDENEEYGVDYIEHKNAMLREACLEFGFSFKPKKKDVIYAKIEKAVKDDFGKNTILEWYDHVTLCVRR